MNTQQAYINGFVKRANEYGINEEQASTLLKKGGILGEPAYTGLSESKTDPELLEGKGIRAHLKRNVGKYTGWGLHGILGGTLGLLGGGAYAAGLKANPAILKNLMSASKLSSKDIYKLLLLGGAGVGAVGGGLGGLASGSDLDIETKKRIESEALKKELIKARGGATEGYQGDPLEGAGPYMLGGLLGAVGLGVGGARIAPNVLANIKKYMKSKRPMSYAETMAKSTVAAPLIKRLRG
jgi:hypothetical protein